MTLAIRVEGLGHRFGSFEALSDVSFEVGRGDVFGFIGPNGAGKTTTLRTMATLHRTDRGRVEIAGLDVAEEPERVRRLIGYMPDHPGVYERLTTEEYLAFFAELQRLADARIAEVLHLTGLETIRERRVSELSKGLQQRVQLARILLHDPEVLLLDEPASDLDPRARVELRDLILELRRRGKTILLSSHILSELADVCTHVGILDHGRMMASGPVAEVVARSGSITAAPPAASPTEGVYRRASDPARVTANLRVIGDNERIVRALAGVPHVGDVVASPLGRVSLTYTGDERVLGAAVKALVDADVLVCAVEPQQNELERAFLNLTRGSSS